MSRFRKRALLGAACVAAGVVIAGCGGGGGGGSATADLARFAPADSIAFGQVAVRPEGSLRDSVNSILDRFPGGSSAGSKLVEGLDKSLAGDHLSYAQNIEPWLGELAGGFVTKLSIDSQGQPQVSDGDAAVIVQATDEDKARQELLAAAKADGPVRESTYKGVQIEDQYAGKNPETFAVFDGVAVSGGNQAAVRAAIDASQGDNLSTNSSLNSFLDERQGDNMAVAYADTAGLLDALQQSGAISADQIASIKKAYGATSNQPFLAALDVESSKVTLDFSAGAGQGSAFSSEESSLIDSIPNDAWVALGLGSIGDYVSRFTTQLGSVGAPGFSTQTIDRALRRQTGISLSDLTQLGDAAVFASGESVLELQIGAVIEAPQGAARDRLLAAMRRAVVRSGQGRISALHIADADGFAYLPNSFPAPVNFATRGDKLVIAVGDTATQTLLDGGSGSDAVDSARDALGGSDFAVSFALQMGPVLNLVDNSGGGNDPSFADARRYLEPIATIAAGGKTDGDQGLFRIVVQLAD